MKGLSWVFIAACGVLSACDREVASGPAIHSPVASAAPILGGQAGWSRDATLLAKLQQPDTTHGAVTDARLNEQHELTVVLAPTVQLTAIRPLLTGLLQQMRGLYPAAPVTVIANSPEGARLAILRDDPARPASSNPAWQQAYARGRG